MIAMSPWRAFSYGPLRFAAASSLCGMLLTGCTAPPHRLAFGDLAAADQIEVSLNLADNQQQITDRSKIKESAAFFERYRDGWVTMPSGGSAPIFLRFLKDGQDVGTFGVGETALTVGSSTRYPPTAEIEAMVRGLGLQWPPPR
jgi:hypothetical protein